MGVWRGRLLLTRRMSIPVTTAVHVRADLVAGRSPHQPILRKDLITMQSVAAYYVLVATELANDAHARPRYSHQAPAKRSRLASFVASFARPVRRSASAAA